MDTKTEKLSLFFEKIKSLGFWQRIFGWRPVKELSYDAYEEFKKISDLLDRIIQEGEQNKNSIAVLNNENGHLKLEKSKLESSLENVNKELDRAAQEISGLKSSVAAKDEKIRSSEKKIIDQDKESILVKEQVAQLTNNVEQLRKENIVFKQTESDRKIKYENDVAGLNAIRTEIQTDRQKEQEERQKSEILRIESMKETWLKHQESVKQTVKMICDKHTIEYVEKVPFKGNPDNTIKLCDEYIIFDAKSPSSENLDNFPDYIKAQTESIRKYIKEENVRRDIYLVIPSNTVQVIKSFSYNMADYNVYIVTIDVLEPLILTLKKIEDYEFVNQLNPEERENICRIIGKFAHMTKRRIQIDHFFTWEFLDILTKCKADLPKEILDKVIEFEKSEKLNPPQERRSKQILNKDLESDNDKIQKEAEAKGIAFPVTLQKDLKGLPLYENENG
ncbi:MAG: hypothetical protein PHP10_00480 [Candidatus Omnitrophica bacterium]|nr:hypothetical protein [Candidatus Omnitrophota bacterium]